MGNRGILHDAERKVVKHWTGKAWVACDPSFKAIDRKPLFQPRRYSELFFLDEATAYAAGHRPCAYCQRERFNAFKSAWSVAHAAGNAATTFSIKDVDASLHEDRVARGGAKVTYTASLRDLPEGAIFEVDGVAFLQNRGRLFKWSFTGYSLAQALPGSASVNVLTPRSVVKLFAAGLPARVHASASV